MLAGQRIWITGASSGIGRAVAIELAKAQARLVISGRNREALQELKKAYPKQIELVLAFDVTNLNANLAAAGHITKQLGGLDKVFLNAGASQHIDPAEFHSEAFVKMIKINYFSLVYGIEAALPLLQSSKAPHIIGMSSMAAYHGLPLGEAYSAAKAASRNLLQGLQVDFKQKGISVSIVCPGFIDTPLTARHRFSMPFLMTAERAASIIVKGIIKRKAEIAFPKPMIWAAKSLNYLPSSWVIGLLARAKLKVQKSQAKTDK
ncbi:MAG: putative Glucose/ribitol dehydrogenase [Gammaproteobacteria bacterium]|jgi:NAD(P)-dependent dehydrogenase (short-subunit alcohol dehydrogenase family)|nr:putative Glucose/ribitol dehydrogenase [Gammaproteobacteria bacterium]